MIGEVKTFKNVLFRVIFWTQIISNVNNYNFMNKFSSLNALLFKDILKPLNKYFDLDFNVIL